MTVRECFVLCNIHYKYKYLFWLTFHPRDIWSAVMQSEMSRRPGRLKPPEAPTSLALSASHRDEVRAVLDMLDDITTTTDVVREEARFSHADPNIFEETYYLFE